MRSHSIAHPAKHFTSIDVLYLGSDYFSKLVRDVLMNVVQLIYDLYPRSLNSQQLWHIHLEIASSVIVWRGSVGWDWIGLHTTVKTHAVSTPVTWQFI